MAVHMQMSCIFLIACVDASILHQNMCGCRVFGGCDCVDTFVLYLDCEVSGFQFAQWSNPNKT